VTQSGSPAGGDATQAYQEGTKAFLSGDLAAARAAFERAIKLDPSHAASYKNLGTVYQKLGETAKAKKSYEKYLQIAPAAKDADLIRKRIAEL
jgi:Tfp pilus assembly protein PilF